MGWQQDQAEAAANARGRAHELAQKAPPAPTRIRCLECGSSVDPAHALMLTWVFAVPSSWCCGFDHARAVNRSRLSSSLPPLNFELVAPPQPPPPSGARTTRPVEVKCGRIDCREVFRFTQALNTSDGQWTPDVSGVLKMAGWRGDLCSGNCESILAGDAKLRKYYEPPVVAVTRLADESMNRERDRQRAARGLANGLPPNTTPAVPPTTRRPSS
jgi:hypothetical protein